MTEPLEILTDPETGLKAEIYPHAVVIGDDFAFGLWVIDTDTGKRLGRVTSHRTLDQAREQALIIFGRLAEEANWTDDDERTLRSDNPA